jgi:hypothetical protein
MFDTQNLQEVPHKDHHELALGQARPQPLPFANIHGHRVSLSAIPSESIELGGSMLCNGKSENQMDEN